MLAGAGADLERLARSSETEIEAVAHAFKSLASQADTILQQAAAIVGCVEKESMGSVLASVQSLCLTVKDFLGRRLEAATTILATLREEEKLLRQLIRVTQSQEAIARHLRALSVLTNVEVAHLGSTGSNFQLAGAGIILLFEILERNRPWNSRATRKAAIRRLRKPETSWPRACRDCAAK